MNINNQNVGDIINSNVENVNEYIDKDNSVPKSQADNDTLERIAKLEQYYKDNFAQMQKIRKMLRKDIKFYPLLLLEIMGFGFVFFGVCIYLNRCWCFNIEYTSAILTFVGIITTFIVVSNYAQTKDTERKFRDDFAENIKEASDTFDKKIESTEQNISKKVKNIEQNIKSIESQKKEINEMRQRVDKTIQNMSMFIKESIVNARNIDNVLPKLTYYMELIYILYKNTNIWKEDVLKNITRYTEYKYYGDDKLYEQYPYLKLFHAFKYISKAYESYSMSKSFYWIPAHEDMNEYQNCVVAIYYSINNNNMQEYMDISVLNDNDKENTIKLITKINVNYSNEPLSIELISRISYDVEDKIVNLLVFLTDELENMVTRNVKGWYIKQHKN